jgi:hypothetical protein
MATEVFSFDKGMNRKKGRLLYEQGELYECKGFSFEHEGILQARTPKTISYAIDSASTSTINSIHRYGDDLYSTSKALCYGTASKFTSEGVTQPTFNYIYYRDIDGTTWTNIYLSASNDRPRYCDFEDFVFMVDGERKQAFYKGKDYEWGFPAPDSAPILTKGAGGSNPDGIYECYYTYYVTFPNGKVVESAPSPVKSIDVTGGFKIEWSGISSCPYEGDGLILHRRLYRDVAGTVYLLTEISNNTTESYSDNITDANLQAATILETESYVTPPSGAYDIIMYLQRVFCIKDSSLYWSESYMPFTFLDTSDAVITKDNEPLVALIDWGDQLYMCSASRWYRLQGSDPDTWSIKRTFADNGIINRNTLKKTKYGLVGLWYDGVYNFDGVVSKNLTIKYLGRKFFTDLPDLSLSYAEYDGTYYWLYYSTDGITIDKCIIIDFSGIPEYRIIENNWIADAHEYYREDGKNYYAKDGYEYTNSGTETISTSIITGDKVFGAIQKRKCLDYLYYDIDTSSKNVTVNITVDGTTKDSLVLNHSSRIRNRSRKLIAAEGYRFGLEISCSDSQNLAIYAPWILEATPVGE